MSSRIMKWLFFSVLVSLVPLVLSGLILSDHGQLKSISDVWRRGELFLISLIGTAAAVGDLMASKTTHSKRKMAIVGLAGILGLVVTCWYVELTSNAILTLAGQPNTLQANILAYSPWVYLCSLILGLACVMLPPH